MVNITFIGQSVLDIRGKLQCLNEALEMNLSQLVDIAFNVYHARKLKQTAIFLETVQGNQKERWGMKRKGKDPLSANQCAYCKKEVHWRKDCQELKNRNKRIETLAEQCQKGMTNLEAQGLH